MGSESDDSDAFNCWLESDPGKPGSSGNRYLADDETVRLTANGFEVAQYDSIESARADAALVGGEAVKARFSMESDEVKVRVL